MSAVPKNMEAPGQQPDPVILLENLNGMDTDQKKYNHLRAIFVEEADVDEYIQFLDTDADIDLTKRQLTQLKATLEGYKVYLIGYLEQTGERIGRFDERLKEVTEAFANPEATPKELEGIGKTRRRVAQAMYIAKVPRGVKGKSLREVTQNGSASGVETKKELSPEQQEELLNALKTRFEGHMERHNGMKWADVMAKLEARKDKDQKLWEMNEWENAGHELDVIGKDEKTGEYLFFSCSEEAPKGHRNIVYDKEAQDWWKENYPDKVCNGNAVDIAEALGAELGSGEQYGYLQKLGKFDLNTWVWLQTPADLRKSGAALDGSRNFGNVYVVQYDAGDRYDFGALRVALRV